MNRSNLIELAFNVSAYDIKAPKPEIKIHKPNRRIQAYECNNFNAYHFLQTKDPLDEATCELLNRWAHGPRGKQVVLEKKKSKDWMFAWAIE